MSSDTFVCVLGWCPAIVSLITGHLLHSLQRYFFLFPLLFQASISLTLAGKGLGLNKNKSENV